MPGPAGPPLPGSPRPGPASLSMVLKERSWQQSVRGGSMIQFGGVGGLFLPIKQEGVFLRGPFLPPSFCLSVCLSPGRAPSTAAFPLMNPPREPTGFCFISPHLGVKRGWGIWNPRSSDWRWGEASGLSRVSFLP